MNIYKKMVDAGERLRGEYTETLTSQGAVPMGVIKSFSLVVSAGIVAVGLTVSDARAAEFNINTDDGNATVQDISIESDRNDLSGGGEATKSQVLDGGQREDFSLGGNDILDQLLGGGFRLDIIDESSYDIQKSLDDGYVQKILDDGQGSFDQ